MSDQLLVVEEEPVVVETGEDEVEVQVDPSSLEILAEPTAVELAVDPSDVTLVVEDSPVTLVVEQGFKGDKGDPGSGTGYSHVQNSASTEWTITHNLGYRPSRIALYTNDGTNVLGFITEPVDENTLKVHYGVAISGRADIS